MKQNEQTIDWPKLAILFVSFLVLSFGLAYLFQYLCRMLQLPLDKFAWLTYLIVFGTTLISNLTIIAPVPFATSIMLAATTHWDPVLLALFASIGGAIGELSGYYLGYLGRKTAIDKQAVVSKVTVMVASWMKRYGVWAISFLAFQPIIPFDIGGLVAGVARMPLFKFLPALWIGKFIKYVLLCYSVVGVINHIPFWQP